VVAAVAEGAAVGVCGGVVVILIGIKMFAQEKSYFTF
jgi:hypothetical protein